MERLLVVRLGSLGDLVHTLPAVAAVRRTSPTLEIDWLVDAVHRDFLSLVPVLTGIMTLADRTAGAWLRARRQLKARRYDVAVDFQGLIKSAALARLSGARRVLGFERAALREGAASLFYTEQIRADDRQHVVEKNLRLAAAVGAEAGPLEFPIGEVRSEIVTAFVAAQALPIALMNPGAAWPNKRWPAHRLAEVCRAVHERHRLTPVVLWGPGEEWLAQSVANASGKIAVVAPPTGLQEFVALARSARLMVSGDTGPLHIAAALGVPAVALFGPTDPLRNGPWDPADVNLSRYDHCDCHYQRACRHDTPRWCLGAIEVGQVLAAIDLRLDRAKSGADPRTELR